MSKSEATNVIAAAFENFGVLSHPDDWEFSDCLEAHYPAMLKKIIASNCLETADRLLAELQGQIAVSSAPEAQRLIDWLQGYRKPEVEIGGSLRLGMNRGIVTE